MHDMFTRLLQPNVNKMIKQSIYTFILFSLLFLTSCISNKKTSLEAFNQDIYTPEYAAGFKILGATNVQSTLIQVFNPWQGSKEVEMSYFISRNGEQAPTGFTGPTIPAGAKRIVCMSSSYIAMLDALGQVNRIVAVSGIDYVSNPYILAHKDSIKDMGPEMNYELLLGLKPDIVLLYGIGDAQTAITDKLKELSIPYIYMGEYLEESPLGKAEWMVVLSELTDSREKGIEIFSEIPKRYLSLKALTESVGQCPTVMFNMPWNDSWVMPSTKSYMAQLVADAGAEYIYKENSSNSSTPIGLETAYGLIQKADYWINVGSATSLDELKTVNPKFADAKAVRERTVYNNNLRLTPTGGNDYWESAVVHPDMVLRDLIHIFHPELVPDSLYYYRHLE
ncbi:ABC-type Fe3+-citrate transport system%2C periplasmic component [uncultured Bacteroides sp.]|nr:ABC-type Fe3+-citrate transport system%2C periplasmic component [uncultured Bacteroides sp.]